MPLAASPSLPTVVIGGGISGLTVAWRLRQAGRRVQLLDRRLFPGGRMQTERRDGFLVEHGPNGMISPAAGAERLIAELGLAGERLDKGPGVRHRYLVRAGRAHALPMDPLGFFGSSFFSLRGRLRLLGEPFVPRRAGDETVADFVRRRFGRELLDYVFTPLVGGLYAGDPETLSVSALLPRLKQLEIAHGSVIRGAARKWRAGMEARYDPRRRQLFSFREGMGSLPRCLAAQLGDAVVSGVRVERLEALGAAGYRLTLRQGAETRTLRAAEVVIALPAYAASRLLESMAPPVAQALADIPHPPLAVVALGLRRGDVAHPLDGLGVLTPAVERRQVLGFMFSSTLYAGRAPDGHVLLTAYVGGARQPELARLPREELVARVRDEATQLLGCRADPVFASVRYWDRGLPQPGLGHGERLQQLRDFEAAHPGLAFAGNYLGGVAASACIDEAIAAADRLARKSALAERRHPQASIDSSSLARRA